MPYLLIRLLRWDNSTRDTLGSSTYRVSSADYTSYLQLSTFPFQFHFAFHRSVPYSSPAIRDTRSILLDLNLLTFNLKIWFLHHQSKGSFYLRYASATYLYCKNGINKWRQMPYIVECRHKRQEDCEGHSILVPVVCVGSVFSKISHPSLSSQHWQRSPLESGGTSVGTIKFITHQCLPDCRECHVSLCPLDSASHVSELSSVLLLA